MVKAVFRFLDTDEWRRIRILQQQEIRKYLERSVRHLLREERITKTRIVEPQQNAFVFCDVRIDSCYAGNPLSDTAEYGIKAILVFPLHELHEVTKVVTVHVQVPLRAGDGQAPGCIRCEIGKIPPLKKIPESGDTRMITKRP